MSTAATEVSTAASSLFTVVSEPDPKAIQGTTFALCPKAMHTFKSCFGLKEHFLLFLDQASTLPQD